MSLSSLAPCSTWSDNNDNGNCMYVCVCICIYRDRGRDACRPYESSCPPQLLQAAIDLVPQWCQLSSVMSAVLLSCLPQLSSSAVLSSSRLPYSLSLSGVSCPSVVSAVPQWCQLSLSGVSCPSVVSAVPRWCQLSLSGVSSGHMSRFRDHVVGSAAVDVLQS